jgi:hypothetical protein
MIRLLIILSTVLVLFNSCGGPGGAGGLGQNKEKVSKQHNFILLLDLSDRLIDQDQVKRDLNIIENVIWPEFLKIVKKKVYVKSKDAFQIVFANQENSIFSPTDLFRFQDSLSIDLSTELVRNKKKKTDYFKNNFGRFLKNIYKKASFSKDKNAYYGADIYKYFNEDLANEIVKSSKESNVINHIFILTDGYLYIKGQSDEMTNEFPSVKQKFNSSKVDVCLLELNPKARYKDEFQRLKIVWSNWFVKMGIKHVQCNKQNSITNTKSKLEDFLINPGEYLVSKQMTINPSVFKMPNNEVFVEAKKKSIKKNKITSSVPPKPKVKNKNTKDSDYSKLDDSAFIEVYLTEGIFLEDGTSNKSQIQKISSLFENNFPSKETLNYLYLCSAKDKLLNQLKVSGVHSPNFETKLKTLCH